MNDQLPEDCRQRLMNEGKPYPKSYCNACGPFSPKWTECNAKIESKVDSGSTKIKPLSPDEIIQSRKAVIPDFVIVAVNELLIKYYNTPECKILQDEIVDKIIAINPNITRNQVFADHMLDFENVFSDYGWIVKHHKVFREPSYFTFEVKDE